MADGGLFHKTLFKLSNLKARQRRKAVLRSIDLLPGGANQDNQAELLQ